MDSIAASFLGNSVMSNIIEQLEAEQMKDKLPPFAPGDTVEVQVKVKEGNRERQQTNEDEDNTKHNSNHNTTKTEHKETHDESVERVFQTHSPVVANIK